MAKSLRLVRFTNWRHLKHLSRELLKKLVNPFVTKITGRGIALPSEDLEDKDYYTQWIGRWDQARAASAWSSNPKAATTFRIVSKAGVRSPESSIGNPNTTRSSPVRH